MKINSLLLYKAQLYSQFHFNSYQKNVGVAQKSKGKLFLLGLAYLSLGLLFIGYSIGLSFGLCSIGMSETVPSIALAICGIITLIFTVFKSGNTLFAFRDYEMLTALPIKTSDIISSRFLMMYTMSTLTNLLLMLPMGIVYGVMEHKGVVFYFAWVAGIFLSALVPITIASIIGAFVAFVSTKFKHKNVAGIIFSLLAFVLIMTGSFSLSYMGSSGDITNSQIADLSRSVSSSVNKFYPLSAFFSDAINNGNVLSFILLAVISIGWYILFLFLLSKKYKAINTALMSTRSFSNYKFVDQKSQSPLLSLYKKELKRFFSCTVYFMNTAMGAIMAVFFGVLLCFADVDALLPQLVEHDMIGYVTRAVPFIISMLLGMSCTSCVSLSMEGKQLWILQSSPVKPITIFMSKILVNMTITVPAAIITSVIAAIKLSVGIGDTIAFILIPLAYSVFVAFWGMFVNVKIPNFDWISEVVLVKQSAVSMIGMLGGSLFAVVPLVISILLANFSAALFNIAVFAILLLIIAVLYMSLKKAKLCK